jgi:hypothetical protein
MSYTGFKRLTYHYPESQWYEVYDPQFRDGVCTVIADSAVDAIIFAYRWNERNARSIAANLVLFWQQTKAGYSLREIVRYDMGWSSRVRLYKEEIERYLTLI